jgi:hypothetical protein
MTNSDLQRKRDLRLRIGRMRRRINNRLHAAGQEGRKLFSWREYVNRYPGYALLAAFSTGLAASSAPGRKLLFNKLGLRILRRTADRAVQGLWSQIQQVWSQSGDEP